MGLNRARERPPIEDEHVSILNSDEHKLSTKDINSMKVQWKNRPI